MNQLDAVPVTVSDPVGIQPSDQSDRSTMRSSAERRADSDARMRAQGQTRISLWLPTKLVESLDAIVANAAHCDRAALIAGMLTYMDSHLATGELHLQPG